MNILWQVIINLIKIIVKENRIEEINIFKNSSFILYFPLSSYISLIILSKKNIALYTKLKESNKKIESNFIKNKLKSSKEINVKIISCLNFKKDQ